MHELRIRADGYVTCRSGFYTAVDILPEKEAVFSVGVNRLTGEIDSGIWAVSYLLSMYEYRPKDFAACREAAVIVDGQTVSLKDLSRCSCYIDEKYPLFSSRRSTRRQIVEGLKRSGMQHTPEEIRSIFGIDESRFDRPIKAVGNARYQAMAAVAYAHGRTIFCFPWMSRRRLAAVEGRLSATLQTLTDRGMLVILPHS